MADDTWTSVVIPILEWTAGHEDDRSDSVMPSLGDIADAIGTTALKVDHELERMFMAGLVSGEISRHSGPVEHHSVWNLILLERGSRIIGQWPADDNYDALLQLLDQQIAAAPEADEKTKLTKVRDAIASMGRDVAVNLITSYLQSRGL